MPLVSVVFVISWSQFSILNQKFSEVSDIQSSICGVWNEKFESSFFSCIDTWSSSQVIPSKNGLGVGSAAPYSL